MQQAFLWYLGKFAHSSSKHFHSSTTSKDIYHFFNFLCFNYLSNAENASLVAAITDRYHTVDIRMENDITFHNSIQNLFYHN